MAGDQIKDVLLRGLNYTYRLAEHYTELMDAFDQETSDFIEYENYFNQIDRIWKRIEEASDFGEDVDDIFETWEPVHIKACEVMTIIKPITFTHYR